MPVFLALSGKTGPGHKHTSVATNTPRSCFLIPFPTEGTKAS